MEEDVAGPREEVFGEHYTVCSRCKRPAPRRETVLILEIESEETRSEQEEICAKCREELERSGEGNASG